MLRFHAERVSHQVLLGGGVRRRFVDNPAVPDDADPVAQGHHLRQLGGDQNDRDAIWRLEAEKRLEPTFYEAEWAYLPCYDDLGKNPKQIFYAASPACSGKMKVSNIGGSEENIAEWKEVYSEKGGEYDMTIYYSCDKNRKLEVSVNETKTEIKDLNSGNKEKVTSVTIPVTLVAGNNVIRMGNNFGWAPDIDCFKLSKRQ